MKTSYFKRLMVLSNTISERVSVEKEGTKEYNRWFECQRVLSSVIKYALNSGKGSLNTKITVFWNCGCDYTEALERLDVSYEVLRACLARASRKLYNELGVNVLDFISEGKPVDAHIEFMVKTGQLLLDDVIPAEVVSLLPVPTFHSIINIEECTEELKLLKTLTLVSLKQSIQNVNPNRLAHLLAILGGDGDYSSILVKKKLWGYLIGKDELKQTMNDLKVKNLIQ